MASLSSKPHTCGVCSKSLASLASLKGHMLVHCDNKPHNCSVCKQAFKTKNAVERHMKRHSNVRPYLCNVCGGTFKTVQSLNKHSQCHKEGLYPCTQCEKVYKVKRYLLQHIRESHEVSGSLECSECGKYFRGKFRLKQHLKRHLKELCSFTKICEIDDKSEIEIKYECKICNDRITGISYLRAHIDSHPEVVTFSCDKCEEIFLSKDALSEHVQAHSVERSVECNVCGEKFTSDHYLRIHRQEHRRENGLVCEVCQRGFPSESKLQKHLRIHNGEKPFKCEECGKCFAEKGHLNVHFRVHTGEKPYQCDLCNNRFVTNSSLKKHIFRHNIKQYKYKSSVDEIVGESSGVRIDTHETVQVYIKEEASDSDGKEYEEDRNPIEDVFIKCELSMDEAGDSNECAMETDDDNDLSEGSINEYLNSEKKISPKDKVDVLIKTEMADVFEDKALEHWK